MVREIIMPKLGETMEEGYLAKWLKQEGQKVEKGEVILEVMSDKTNFEVESPYAGYLRKILVPASEKAVPVTSVIGYLADSLEEPIPAAAKTPSVVETPAAPGPTVRSEEPTPYSSSRSDTAAAGPVPASPLAKKLARELSVDLAGVKGTGPSGRITEKDVRAAAAVKTEKKPAAAGIERQKLSALRRIIADRLSKSKREIPHYYLRKVMDVSALVAFRKQLKEKGREATYTDLLLKAVSDCLAEFPEMNATYEDNELIVYPDVNLGLAVARPEGLIVPILKGANHRSLPEITAERKRLVNLAKDNKLSLPDLEGGTFTVSNLGVYDIDSFYPIIYQPQVAIMGVGRIYDGIVADGSTLAVRPLMEITLSCDHRVVDGSYGAQFLQKLQEIINGL